VALSVGVGDLPRSLRGAAVLGGLAAAMLGLWAGLSAIVRSEARAEATATTRSVLAEDIEKFKVSASAAAATAARDGARQATEDVTRNVIAPLAAKVDALTTVAREHIARDEEAQRRTDEAIREIKQRTR